MEQEIKVGATYRVSHTRKGAFVLRVDRLDDVWATGTIVSGRARALLDYNEVETGEEITIRRSFCTFVEVSP